MRSRNSSALRHRHLAGINNARRPTVRVRSNTAENSREQSQSLLIQTQEQTPVVQPLASALSPLLEISYSPIPDPICSQTF